MKVHRLLKKIYTNDDTDFFNTNEVNADMRKANKNIFNPIARKAIKNSCSLVEQKCNTAIKGMQGKGDLYKAETSHLVKDLMAYRSLKML